jgi:predicted dehydrogenase
MTNWGAHHLDIVQWALGMDDSGPVDIEGSAEFNQDKLFETPQSFQAIYKYADGITVTVKSPGKPSGVPFECEKGVFNVNRGRLDTEPEDLLTDAPKETPVKLYVSAEHHENWLDCIKSRKPPICNVAIGHRSATLCHLGNISVRTGKKIKWDPATE